jgi:hypothetical protein
MSCPEFRPQGPDWDLQGLKASGLTPIANVDAAAHAGLGPNQLKQRLSIQ